MDSTAIREALAARGWSQAGVGELLGLEQNQVSKRLRGVVAWRVGEVKGLAEALGCTVDDLLADKLPDAVRERLVATRAAELAQPAEAAS